MTSLSDAKQSSQGGILETVKVVVQALLLALVVRTFLFQPFNIPSGSMKSTLLVGDYIFVSKFSYGYSRYSFPFSPPLFDGRIWAQMPERGDVAVFKLPRDGRTDYIKRVIGLPGDRIQMRTGVLHINGQAVRREPLPAFNDEDWTGGTSPVRRFRETLPNGVAYETLDIRDNGDLDSTQEYVVPEGHLFMMGDNRDNSIDSRVLSGSQAVGFVPFDHLVGRARIIFFSVEEGAAAWEVWRWPWALRWDRMLSVVR